MMAKETTERLLEHGVRPSAQRLAVAEYVLNTTDHPSADKVWREVMGNFPMISKATVYNTLNLFVSKGLLRECVLTEGSVVFDPLIEPHHHLIDEATGKIHDIPWDKVEVCNVDRLKNYEVHDVQVVMRGRLKKRKR